MPLYAPFPGFASASQVQGRSVGSLALSPQSLSQAGVFLLTRSSNQTGITTATDTKVLFPVTEQNQGSFAASSRFTPPAGPVNLSFGLQVGGILVGDACIAYIYKNGAPFHLSRAIADAAGNVFMSMALADLANGTDYYEVYINAVEATPGSLFVGHNGFTFFGGRA